MKRIPLYLVKMKKIVFLGVLSLALLTGNGDIFGQSQIKRASTKTKTVNTKKKSNSNTSQPAKSKVTAKAPAKAKPQALYANFWGIPYDGKVPRIEDFYSDNKGLYSVVPGSKIKDLGIKARGGTMYTADNFKFDSEGKLIHYEWETNANGGKVSIDFVYEDGRLAKLIWNESDIYDNYYEPLVNKVYEYKWDGNKVTQIAESLSVDNGINYVGNPMHMDLYYYDDDHLMRGLCREKPEVKVEFDYNGNVLEQKAHVSNYTQDLSEDKRHKVKSTLAWELIEQPNHRFMNPLSQTFKELMDPWHDDGNFKWEYDKKGNWIKSTNVEDFLLSDERTITYYP